MKNPCDITQRQLLALTEPERPPTSIQAHVETCPACQEYQKRVVQVDRSAALLPYPKSEGKASFLKRLQMEPARQRQRLQLKAWQLTIAWSAAAVLVFILLYNLAHIPTPTPRPTRPGSGPDPWLAELLKKHQTLARADSTRQQVTTLTDLAEDVRAQTQDLVRFVDSRDLQKLAEMYGQAIQVGVRRAADLPKDERRQVLEPIVKQLERALTLAETQARQDKVASADHPLVTMASAARLGKDRLDDLLKEEKLMRGFSSGPALAMLPTHWFTTLTSGRATAQADSRTQTSADSIRQFKRNRKLVEAIVASSIRLADQRDLISRAGQCQRVVEGLADEIRQAAGEKESARVAELAQHLRILLAEVVARNLAKGGVDALPRSDRERQLLEIGNQVIALLNPTEAALAGYQTALLDLRLGRKEVEIAIQGRGK